MTAVSMITVPSTVGVTTSRSQLRRYAKKELDEGGGGHEGRQQWHTTGRPQDDGLRAFDPDNPEYEYFVINEQEGGLFKGRGCPLDTNPLYCESY